ncbi:DUF3168 domain-containing protein [Fictibacillus aquaticus]|uniref:DUF3168 domain-containing protein n=1 Tax=Fictibacillus aquaticus TaxID=2021314 RepID=A0A235F933_9BACL|nr:DUF3168 domain-containing protein [Fictibacillus aquaticus]OYD57871.1 hypothetical protein CGZ90_08185 [Fictibacillus aquaticus]
MSFDAKAELLQALESNEPLVELVTGGFHNIIAPSAVAFPRVVYTEIQNADDEYSDNNTISAEVAFQLSIYTKIDTQSKQTPIAKALDQVMKEAGYTRYDSTDLYEKDTQVFHKPMRYRKNTFTGGA